MTFVPSSRVTINPDDPTTAAALTRDKAAGHGTAGTVMRLLPNSNPPVAVVELDGPSPLAHAWPVGPGPTGHAQTVVPTAALAEIP